MISTIGDVQIMLTMETWCYWFIQLTQCVWLGENQVGFGVIWLEVGSETIKGITLEARVKSKCLSPEYRIVEHDDYHDRRGTNYSEDQRMTLLRVARG